MSTGLSLWSCLVEPGAVKDTPSCPAFISPGTPSQGYFEFNPGDIPDQNAGMATGHDRPLLFPFFFLPLVAIA